MNAFKKLFEETPTNLHNLVFFSPFNETKVLPNEAINKSLRIITVLTFTEMKQGLE